MVCGMVWCMVSYGVCYIMICHGVWYGVYNGIRHDEWYSV